MNLIECKYEQTKYWSVRHPCIFVDGLRLDLLVNKLSSEHDTEDLIPTLFSALDVHNGSDVVWARTMPEDDSELILPLLMCPDDVDLDCSVIVTRVSKCANNITWSGFGLDQSVGDNDSVGSNVVWFSDAAFVFGIEEYLKVLSSFKREICDNKIQTS